MMVRKVALLLVLFAVCIGAWKCIRYGTLAGGRSEAARNFKCHTLGYSTIRPALPRGARPNSRSSRAGKKSDRNPLVRQAYTQVGSRVLHTADHGRAGVQISGDSLQVHSHLPGARPDNTLDPCCQAR